MDLGIKQLGSVIISVMVVGLLVNFVANNYTKQIENRILTEMIDIGTVDPEPIPEPITPTP